MKVNRKATEILIKMSPNVEEANRVIEEKTGFKSIAEKTAFLKGMFDVDIISVHDAEGTSKEKSDEMSYWAMLRTVLMCPVSE